MADYYPVLTRAISALEPNTAEARRAVYERARQAIVKQLRSYDPPLTESEITKERLGLEEAVRRIESETRAAGSPPKPQTTPAASPASGANKTASESRPALTRMTGSEGLTAVHAAAAAAASLGAATASAQANATTTRAAFEPASAGVEPAAARELPARVDPTFERPRVPGPLPEPRIEPNLGMQRPDVDLDDPNPNLREPRADFDGSPRRGPKIGGLVAVLVLAGLGLGAYLGRDTISSYLNGDQTVAVPSTSGPKVADRVGAPTSVPEAIVRDPAPAVPSLSPAPEAAPAVTPAPAAPSASLTSQRAILYDEAPDKQGGAASSGAVVWRAEPVPNNPSETQLVGETSIPDKGIVAKLTLTRNLDNTLPASHVIEVSFTVPSDFANGGIGNVPGVLFKPSEEAGGSALKGMSVKVTKNLFWIGLEASPADREQNLQAIRTRGWIDVPILYDNGRRGVLTLEKGPTGERAFDAAFAAWTATPSAGSPPAIP